jgi:hypothetical protein
MEGIVNHGFFFQLVKGDKVLMIMKLLNLILLTIIYRGLFDQPRVSELSLIESQAGDTSNK